MDIVGSRSVSLSKDYLLYGRSLSPSPYLPPLVSAVMQEKVEDYAINLSKDIDMEYDHMSKHDYPGGEDDINVNIFDDCNQVAIDMDYKRITKLTSDDIFGL